MDFLIKFFHIFKRNIEFFLMSLGINVVVLLYVVDYQANKYENQIYLFKSELDKIKNKDDYLNAEVSKLQERVNLQAIELHAMESRIIENMNSSISDVKNLIISLHTK